MGLNAPNMPYPWAGEDTDLTLRERKSISGVGNPSASHPLIAQITTYILSASCLGMISANGVRPSDWLHCLLMQLFLIPSSCTNDGCVCVSELKGVLEYPKHS